MNCKPGDLALVVRPGACNNPPRLGSIVQVDRICNVYPDCWRLTPPCIDPRDGREIAIPDSDLRPIRDPGDDARDEMLRPLPEEVSA